MQLLHLAATLARLDSREIRSGLSLRAAVVLAGLNGILALGFEIAWYRIFAMASADRAPAFAFLLSTYLSGIAAGAYLSERFTAGAPLAVFASGDFDFRQVARFDF